MATKQRHVLANPGDKAAQKKIQKQHVAGGGLAAPGQQTQQDIINAAAAKGMTGPAPTVWDGIKGVGESVAAMPTGVVKLGQGFGEAAAYGVGTAPEMWRDTKTTFGGSNPNDPAGPGGGTASDAFSGAAGDYGKLANEAWSRTMGGLKEAQGYFDPYESYVQEMRNRGPGAFEQRWQGYEEELNRPLAQRQAYDQFQQYMNQGPGQTEQMFNQFQGAFSDPGMGEQFAMDVLSGKEGNPFERQRQQGQAQINQQMARRGGFNTGGAMTHLGNFNAALDAEAFDAKSRMAMDGQRLGMDRMGMGLNAAQGVDATNINRYGLLGQMGAGADTEDRLRIGAKAGLAGTAQDYSNLNTQMVSDALLKLGGARSGLTSGFYGMGMPMWYGGREGQIGANLDSGLASAKDAADKAAADAEDDAAMKRALYQLGGAGLGFALGGPAGAGLGMGLAGAFAPGGGGGGGGTYNFYTPQSIYGGGGGYAGGGGGGGHERGHGGGYSQPMPTPMPQTNPFDPFAQPKPINLNPFGRQ